MSIDKRYDFALIFDVQDGNPNGDPDAGNLPRTDPETGHGLVTDVCLKRKLRNFVLLTKEKTDGYDIYVKEKAVLGRAHRVAFTDLGIALGEESRIEVPQNFHDSLADFSLPEGLSLEEDDDRLFLVVAADADPKTIKDEIKASKPGKALKAFLESGLKGVKSRKPTGAETEKGREWMCRRFFDVRTFGAVMSLKSAPNCGQVRGPVQLTFSRSVVPIVPMEHSITRMAVATEAEAEKQSGDNRTMGRKATVPYGLYVGHGFFNPSLAAQTGFVAEDLKILWQGLLQMFEQDRSAARGLMATRRVIVFEHASMLGNASAASLFDRVKVRLKDGVEAPRAFSDFSVEIDQAGLPEGIRILEPLPSGELVELK